MPRGRPHYFVNESDGYMTMIWVYAGPLPERIVLTDEVLLETDEVPRWSTGVRWSAGNVF